MFRLFAFSLAALAVTAFTTISMAADKPKDAGAHGVVVSATSKSITVKGKDAEKSYDLADAVKVTIKGKDGKIEDVKAGDHVKLTMTDTKVSAIEVQEAKPKK